VPGPNLSPVHRSAENANNRVAFNSRKEGWLANVLKIVCKEKEFIELT
jgi:hypothetical protein